MRTADDLRPEPKRCEKRAMMADWARFCKFMFFGSFVGCALLFLTRFNFLGRILYCAFAWYGIVAYLGILRISLEILCIVLGPASWLFFWIAGCFWIGRTERPISGAWFLLFHGLGALMTFLVIM